MKRILALLIVCVLTVGVLCACGAEKNDEPAQDGTMTAVKNDAGDIVGYERRYHNDAGNITRLDSYDADQNYLSYILYAYDDAGRLLSETSYAANGFAQSRTVYTYDETGALYEKALEMPHGEATVERYSSDGEVIEKLYYGTDEKLIYIELLENGEWIRHEPDELPTETETES